MPVFVRPRKADRFDPAHPGEQCRPPEKIANAGTAARAASEHRLNGERVGVVEVGKLSQPVQAVCVLRAPGDVLHAPVDEVCGAVEHDDPNFNPTEIMEFLEKHQPINVSEVQH